MYEVIDIKLDERTNGKMLVLVMVDDFMELPFRMNKTTIDKMLAHADTSSNTSAIAQWEFNAENGQTKLFYTSERVYDGLHVKVESKKWYQPSDTYLHLAEIDFHLSQDSLDALKFMRTQMK